ncbi:hypothetical protein [Priestia megaterium]|uniref:hypothetical protein n=1 Tax=Priestia megaterium TaxID=1404 RepID=UPI0020A23293|nr:hypothetical protein [Priestia megaterium]MCP1450341.1 hypothetical protein [Priestia megaterium]
MIDSVIDIFKSSNGHLFWFSILIIVVSLTYFSLVHKEYKKLKNIKEEEYEDYFRKKYGYPDSTKILFNLAKSEIARELDEYKNATSDKIKYFSFISIIALFLSIFASDSWGWMFIGHLLNWYSIINLFWRNLKFIQYWREVVRIVITITSIIFVPIAFYITIISEHYTNVLATYVTILGFPITLASILTFMRPSK